MAMAVTAMVLFGMWRIGGQLAALLHG